MGVAEKFKYQFYRLMCNVTFGKLKQKFYNKKNEYNVSKKLSYDYLRQSGKNIRSNGNVNLENTGLVIYQTLNKLKELDLKRKIREGKKIRVCFFVDGIQRFPFASIWEHIINSDLYEPFMVLYNRINLNCAPEMVKDEHYKSLELLKTRGYNVYDGFDENGNYIPIDAFKPDIIFLCAPYFDYTFEMEFSNIFLNINYLVCYLSYGMEAINYYNYHYNNRRIETAWKQFVFTRSDWHELMCYSKYYSSNAVLTGCPKLDSYTKPESKCKLPEKINNGNPIVIYAPHWTIRNKESICNLSTFHLYYNYFFNLAKQNPDINFVFKPHPILIERVVEQKIMTSNEYSNYVKAWDDLPNGLYVFDGEYIDLFRKSDLMITDCGSFIAEWLPTGMPCIYLANPEVDRDTYIDRFSILGQKILDKYYVCYKQKDIEKNFDMIIRGKSDPIKEDRRKLKDELFINIGCAGEKIVEYLTSVLTN